MRQYGANGSALLENPICFCHRSDRHHACNVLWCAVVQLIPTINALLFRSRHLHHLPNRCIGYVVVAKTFVSIILGELVPKRIALHNPEQIASVLAGPMMVISKILTPFVWLLGRITDFVLKALGIKPGMEPSVTEEEVQLLIDQGTQAGVFEESEHDMVEGVQSWRPRVYSLMTPRTGVVYLDVNDSLEESRDKNRE